MQRLIGATCMAFDHPVLHAQIDRDNMIFATNGNWKSSAFMYLCQPWSHLTLLI
jgi:hypothetical protein